MEPQEIYLFHDTSDELWKNPVVYQISDFGGRLPKPGDFIIDPAIRPSSRNVLTEQTMLKVIRYCFHPHRPDRLAIIVSERPPHEREYDMMATLFHKPISR